MEKHVVVLLEHEKKFFGICLDEKFISVIKNYFDYNKINTANKFDNFVLFKKKNLSLATFLNDFQIFQGTNDIQKDLDSKLANNVQNKIKQHHNVRIK